MKIQSIIALIAMILILTPVFAELGDVDGDNIITNHDAELTFSMALNGGFNETADMDSSGVITANDAQTIYILVNSCELQGDVDKDGVITETDANLAFNLALNGFYTKCANMNNDEIITSEDAQIILGLIEEPTVPTNELKGDFDGDGYITCKDVDGIFNKSLTNEYNSKWDLNDDGKITAEDAQETHYRACPTGICSEGNCTFTEYACENGKERIVIPFNQTNLIETTKYYQGNIELSINGSGRASRNAFNDALYVFTNYYDGTAITPKIQKPFMLYLNNNSLDEFLTTIPKYSEIHNYEINILLNNPTKLKFNIGDSYTSDNYGEITICINGETTNTTEETPINTIENTPINTVENIPINTTEENPTNICENIPINTTEENPTNITEITPISVITNNYNNYSKKELINLIEKLEKEISYLKNQLNINKSNQITSKKLIKSEKYQSNSIPKVTAITKKGLNYNGKIEIKNTDESKLKIKNNEIYVSDKTNEIKINPETIKIALKKEYINAKKIELEPKINNGKISYTATIISENKTPIINWFIPTITQTKEISSETIKLLETETK